MKTNLLYRWQPHNRSERERERERESIYKIDATDICVCVCEREREREREMVEVLESALVVPSEETRKHAIWVSDLDFLFSQTHTPTVYFYRSTGDLDFFSPAAMKAALSNALVPYYPLAGRLGVDRDGRTEINCTGEGALFLVARSDCTIDDLGPLVPSEEMRRLLVPATDSVDHHGILALFQVTFFKCGGVCLGTALSHVAVDGFSAINFISTWSDSARGIQVSTRSLPFFDRTLLRARSPPAVHFDHVEYKSKPQSNTINTKPQPQPFEAAILGLSKDQLNSLKGKADHGDKAGLSTFSVVAGHVWRCACRARRLEPHQETRLYMPVNARNRVRPPLPPGFLGNAVFLKSIVTTVEEVVSSTSVLFGAEKIQSATARIDDEYIRSLIDFLASLELKGMSKLGRTLPTTDLQVISWQAMPIYEADFGWGRPMFMRRAILPYCGIVYIMRSPTGDDGGLSLVVSLEPESMVRFKELFYEGLDCVVSKGV